MKGVILAAGFGTRFLPGTKTIPKEMFPLIDTPAIDLIVREMAEAGIRNILIVTSRRKKALEDYFDREVELENAIAEEDTAKRELIRPPEGNIFFLRQQHMAGTGHALMLVEPFVGNSPFVVAYPDDILLKGPSLSGQLMELHANTGKTVLCGREVPEGDISRYGVIDHALRDGVHTVKGMVEKPAPGAEPSRMVSFGRYLYTPEIFEALRKTAPQGEVGGAATPASGEFTQTDAINLLAGEGRVVVKPFEGQLLDVGSPLGYLQAIVECGVAREEFRAPFLLYLRQLLEREEGA